MHLVHVTGADAARRAHRRDRGLPGTAGPRRALRARPHAAHRGHVRPARARLRVLHLRHLELPERRHRARGRARTRCCCARSSRSSDADGRTWGPGLLCRALQHRPRPERRRICWGTTLWLELAPRARRRPRIARATRIGVDYAGDWAQRPWRFFDRASPYVSTAPGACAPCCTACLGGVCWEIMRPADPQGDSSVEEHCAASSRPRCLRPAPRSPARAPRRPPRPPPPTTARPPCRSTRPRTRSRRARRP